MAGSVVRNGLSLAVGVWGAAELVPGVSLGERPLVATAVFTAVVGVFVLVPIGVIRAYIRARALRETAAPGMWAGTRDAFTMVLPATGSPADLVTTAVAQAELRAQQENALRVALSRELFELARWRYAIFTAVLVVPVLAVGFPVSLWLGGWLSEAWAGARLGTGLGTPVLAVAVGYLVYRLCSDVLSRVASFSWKPLGHLLLSRAFFLGGLGAAVALLDGVEMEFSSVGQGVLALAVIAHTSMTFRLKGERGLQAIAAQMLFTLGWLGVWAGCGGWLAAAVRFADGVSFLAACLMVLVAMVPVHLLRSGERSSLPPWNPWDSWR
ncbi:hypothetical protein JCM3263A_18510 [Thermobifida fusca]|uniref:hypothetical protein n=1 Tax=Thermobifida fusca TaxID=2021 RepID=UPI000B1EE3D8|nr:hypothetical protein [Thermobifida fusca]